MTAPSPIVVPIALNHSRSATLTLPWFVQRAEYSPAGATYKPLVNGEEAFGALYDALDKATCTIDYVCWGFQPSMYFKRDGGKSLRIGDLLIKKAKAGVKVRILCWLDKAWAAQVSEQEMPEYDTMRYMTQNEDALQRAYDRNWYYCATRPRGATSQVPINVGPQIYPQRQVDPWPLLGTQSLKDVGIELVTRDFSQHDRAEIMHREKLMRDAGIGPTIPTIAAYGAEPSHHQKMVLIDYEKPQVAVGFVMGHNTLDAYWDTDAHSHIKKAPNLGRNGETPRQDLSAVMAGPILASLNDNFCRAWQRDAKEDLLTRRRVLRDELKPRDDIGIRVMAQIHRTQSQEGVRNIRSMYLQAVNNVSSFIYIENQYFRWPELAEKIKSAAKVQVEWGRDPAKHSSIHLFVVTNASKEGMGLGAGTTYDMLNSLGRSDTMPIVAREERSDALNRELAAAQKKVTAAHTQMCNANGAQEQAAAQRALDNAQAKAATLEQRVDENIKNVVLPQPIPGLKVQVCSLVALDSPPENWMPVYVHSKIMIVDDVFLTHGSANINRRSMEVDSELNICHECMNVTQPLRRRLWKIHTNGIKGAASDSPVIAAQGWDFIIKRNAERQNSKTGVPIASLIGFMWNSTSRLRLD